MNAKEFKELAYILTGTSVKEVDDELCKRLDTILSDDDKEIDYSQFNELLLLVNKDRIEEPFFKYFFINAKVKIKDIPEGIERFQKTAMLRYGNFIFAYRTLSKIKTDKLLIDELQEVAYTKEETKERFDNRTSKLSSIDKIERDMTYYVGVITGITITAEHEVCYLLNDIGGKFELNQPIDVFFKYALDFIGEEYHDKIKEVCECYIRHGNTKSAEDFYSFIHDSLPKLQSEIENLEITRKVGLKNQDTYLTWDHMDVYFATSMRKKWEYESLFDFINELMKRTELEDLEIRYFDPTQCFTENRIDKGVLEALMLKRAKCTVYSVQDTDTLGKDSELAATLAQGKPVIAYVPTIDVEARKEELQASNPHTLIERSRFLSYADKSFQRELESHELIDFAELNEYPDRCIWTSIQLDKYFDELKKNQSEKLDKLSELIAIAEGRVYDKRASTLKEHHPLAIQVNLQTGVANGVLVVREVADCAKLLRDILLHDLVFSLERKNGMWHLIERISGCTYRIVTKNRKLSNSFWNFYLKEN